MQRRKVHHLAEGGPQSNGAVSRESLVYYIYIYARIIRVQVFIPEPNALSFIPSRSQAGGTMRLHTLSRADAALYICLVATAGAEAQRIDNAEARRFESVDGTFIEAMKVRLIVRSVPCAVTRLTMRISTILGVLIWEYNRNTTYSHPLKSFTSEYRMYNSSWPAPWERLDPINISPNVVSARSVWG